ncbi:GntR family transcriptional regulator [Streptantibioticus ferralitis]|uniref:GntR family transcriptional regulator n=1 Tax=Streptantibioticus ferralitis TaxID=236510 RepID=A0ABT5YY73_9ACTN|nr:GntR family transcriptional regulator [Streptantibioticus ferralitis]MDF2256261.1 GntR family transcriptional regulator [Streptantibioticus ferralitis]
MDSTSPDLLGEFAADRLLLGRSSTVQKVADVLRGRIAAGALRSGTRLSEEALGGALGVSRNTLREAFRVLAHERLVVHEMNRGVFVRSLGPADVADIYVTRRALETAGLRAATGSSRLAAVSEAVAAGESAARDGDWAAVADADLRFHRAIGGLTGSERIDAYLAGLLAELRLAFAVMADPRALHEPFLRRNREIAELLVDGRTGRAEAELIRYLDDAQALIVARMRQHQETE